MAIVLITGGNKGLGYETARRLILEGHKVYIGTRDKIRGQKAASDLGATFLHLDVTNDTSVNSSVIEFLKHENHLDILINNAGISGGMITPDALVVDMMQQTYNTNVFGIVRMIHTFLPLLRSSDNPVVVNVSSGLGSFGTVLNPDKIEYNIHVAHYNSSKSAVNMLTLQYAKAIPSVLFNSVDPGYTATDLNNNSGPQTVSEGTDVIVKMATIGKNGPTGTFSDRNGMAPW